MIRNLIVRTAAVAVVTTAAFGFAGTAFADEDPTAGESSQSAEAITYEPGTLPEACSLLPLELAQTTIADRAQLTLTSTSGGVECLYQDPDGSYAVDLDLSEQTAESLEQARLAWSSPGVEIADATGLGDGAFTALNNGIDAVTVCAKDGIQYDLEVWAPDAEFAQTQVATLAQLYCGVEETPAA